MMLSEIQTILVEKKLKEAGLSYAPLFDEILDHLCCLVEKRMLRGDSFEKAIDQAFNSIGPDGIVRCQNETNYLVNRNKIIMKRITLATCGLAASCLLITTVLTAQDLPSVMPLKEFRITSPFGARIHPISKKLKHHNGIDLKAPLGTPVIATADGIVVQTENNPDGYGKFVVIEHANNYRTKYAQLSEFKVLLGTEIKQGHIIGLVGSSGVSTAPHLHYEVIKDENPIDPLTIIKGS